MFVCLNQNFHVRYNQVSIVKPPDPLLHNPNLSNLFYKYMYHRHRNHDQSMWDADNQLFLEKTTKKRTKIKNKDLKSRTKKNNLKKNKLKKN